MSRYQTTRSLVGIQIFGNEVLFVLLCQPCSQSDLLTTKIVWEMASCKYASLVGGLCGYSVENPANSQCITIGKCTKDISNHLRTFGAGFADSTMKTEAELLPGRQVSINRE